MFELLFFSLLWSSLSFPAGLAVFRAIRNCGQREDKARVRSAARPGYPNFGGTRKFETEGSVSSWRLRRLTGAVRRPQTKWPLPFLPDAVISHGKTPILSAANNSQEKIFIKTSAPKRQPWSGSGPSFRERSSKDPAAHWYSIDPRLKQQGVTRIYASRPTVL